MSYDSGANSFEFLPGRLYYVPVTSTPAPHPQRHYFTIDHQLQYWNFFLDFGPLNLCQLYRFCAILNQKLSHSKLRDKVIYYYSSSHPHKRTNAAFLICAWSMICLNRTPEEAFRPFKGIAHTFPPWHDATQGVCTFNLTIMDTLKGIHRARDNQFFDFNRFPIDEYEHYEKVENGDLNWCMEGKFIAFAGPQGQAGVSAAENSHDTSGYQPLQPENYVEYFKFRNVTLVVRLNKKYYDARSFTNNGINHVELYFLDGSNPPDNILTKFMQMAESTPGAVAVHCKAGLGRTGSLIGCYLMKHFRFTGEEVIGWLRICRPGSIIGPQQHWLKSMQQRMWQEGELYRTKLQELELQYKPGPLDQLSAASDYEYTAESGRSSRKPSSRRPSSSRTGGDKSARNSANVSLSSKMALLNVVNSYDAMNSHSSKTRSDRGNEGHQSLSSRNSGRQPSSSILSGSGRHIITQTQSQSQSQSRPQSKSLSPRSQALYAMSDSTQTFTAQQESEGKSQADYLLARRLQKQQAQSSAASSEEYKSNGGHSTHVKKTVQLQSTSGVGGVSSRLSNIINITSNGAASPPSSDDDGNKRKSRFGNFLSSFGKK